MTRVGVDIGTFHTLAVSLGSDGVLTIPPRSVPSIALLRRTPIVGFDAVSQLDLNLPLLQAPKLEMSSPTSDRQLLATVLGKLAAQSLDGVARDLDKPLTITVPPAWDLEKCELLSEALCSISRDLQFMHEPIALLVAAWYLAPRHPDQSYRAKLDNFREILVCDWGAGTVDLAAVSVNGAFESPEFRCIRSHTDRNWGGTSLARRAVDKLHASGTVLSDDKERIALYMQQEWAGTHTSPVPLAALAPLVSKQRQQAAVAIRMLVNDLIHHCSSPKKVLFIMHGGPLESAELRSELSDELESVGITTDRQIHLGNDFTKQLSHIACNLRRDSLVAAGAALYATCGKALPEFAYQINLRDSFRTQSSSLRLAITPHTKGIQAVTPPFTGVDYVVDVQQLRQEGSTPMKKELEIHCRQDAVLLYRVAAASVGYARIEVTEAKNLPTPIPFSDACRNAVTMPETSTRFQLDFGALK